MALHAGAVTVRIVGLKGLARAAAAMGTEGWAMLERHLLIAGAHVATGVRQYYLTVNAQPDQRGAGGIDNQASTRGAFVVQTIRKAENVSMRRPNYGPRMMRKAFLPAAWQGRDFVLMQAMSAVEEAKKVYWDSQSSVIF